MSENKKNEDAQEERRLYDRSRIILDVHFDGTDATGIASTRDISTGGLYMHTQAKLREGSKLMLRIPCEGEYLVVEAEVVFSIQDSGVGVRFNNLSDDDHVLIEKLKKS
jgi:hypothetical protein